VRSRAADAANQKFRYNAFREGRRACEFCGARPNRTVRLVVSHIIPDTWGGSREEQNLVFLCQKHAVMSDRAGGTLSARAKRREAYRGPRTRRQLFATLRRWEKEETGAKKRYWLVASAGGAVVVGEEIFFPTSKVIGGRCMWAIPYTVKLRRALRQERPGVTGKRKARRARP
jgi:hypothetical protein